MHLLYTSMQSLPPDSFLYQAIQCLSKGDATQAIDVLKDGLAKEPTVYQAWLLLSKCLFDVGSVKEAVKLVKHAEQFDPLHADFQAIQVSIQNNALIEAKKRATAMLIKVPGHPRAIFTLAHIASVSNQADQSIAILQDGLTHSPANTHLRQMLSAIQDSAGYFESAITSARALAEIDDSFQSLWLLINLLLRLGQHKDLLNLCERAKIASKGNTLMLSQVELVRGQTLRIVGERQQAITAFRNSIKANASNSDAWWALADMKNYEFSDHDKSLISRIIEANNASAQTKCVATFALAKAYESTGKWDVAMRLYNDANAQRNNDRFSPHQIEQEFKKRIQSFSKEHLAIQASAAKQTITPIFIVGLPRSGSTLVEQMLASHSKIQGTIEQPTMACIEKEAHALCVRKFNKDLFSAIAKLSVDDLEQLGESYLNKGRLFRHEHKSFFIDKLPFNFRHIGLIHKILPKAIIIDVRRNPLDCGFSLYKQYFPSGVDFSYKLSNIGAFYNAYIDLMNHWQQVLPNKVLQMQYEELIQSPELHIRRTLTHIGLEFEAACLNFHRNTRVVHTASSEQVRQAINTKGIGVWHHAGNAIETLKNSLSADVLNSNRKYIDAN